MANKIFKNKKILYVCFEVNHKNIFNLSFCLVIVNAPKIINALMKWLVNTVKNYYANDLRKTSRSRDREHQFQQNFLGVK